MTALKARVSFPTTTHRGRRRRCQTGLRPESPTLCVYAEVDYFLFLFFFPILAASVAGWGTVETAEERGEREEYLCTIMHESTRLGRRGGEKSKWLFPFP